MALYTSGDIECYNNFQIDNLQNEALKLIEDNTDEDKESILTRIQSDLQVWKAINIPDMDELLYCEQSVGPTSWQTLLLGVKY